MSRGARFIWVGAGGFMVQVVTLHALAAAGLPYTVATALAVEAAILHNFIWHERWTWGDRVAALKTCSQPLTLKTAGSSASPISCSG